MSIAPDPAILYEGESLEVSISTNYAFQDQMEVYYGIHTGTATFETSVTTRTDGADFYVERNGIRLTSFVSRTSQSGPTRTSTHTIAAYADTATEGDETIVVPIRDGAYETVVGTVTITIKDGARPVTTLGLTAGSITSTGATLTLTGHSGDWYYKADKAPHNACSAAQSGATAALTGLTAATAYTYTAYSDSACATTLASVTFTTAAALPNTAPAFAAATAARSVAENSAAGANVGAVIPAATDADGDSLTYTMGGTDAASFAFNASTRQITTRAGVTYDHEAKSSYTVTVTASDDTDSDTVTVTITVTDVAEPPIAPAAPTVTATSGSTTGLDVSWTAPANAGKPAIVNYDVQYRAGNSGAFTNGPQNVTGTSTALTGLTANTSYQVRVRATNAEGDGPWSPSGTGTTGTNSAPAFAAATAARSVAENSAAGANVGAVIPAATDADGDSLTYTMGGTDAASFAFNASTRQITTRAGVTYDHEAKSSYTVTVTASDDTDSDTVTVTITVTDVAEPPIAPAAPTVTATSGSTTGLDVSWTAPANAGKPAIVNYDVQYRAGNSGAFTNGPQNVTGTSTALTGLTANTSYQVRVRATNAEGDGPWSPSGTGTTGTNSAPAFAAATAARSVAENSAAGANVGAVIPAATDADGDSLTYTMGGTDAASFAFNASTRQITTRAGVTYDHEAKSSYTVTVTASDDTDSDTVTVTITVTDVAEPPIATSVTVIVTVTVSLSVSSDAVTVTV